MNAWRTGLWEGRSQTRQAIGIIHRLTLDATDHLTLAAAEGRRLYAFRAQIEAGVRVGTDQLGLTSCQARSARAQLHHRACCLVAFGVLERERHVRGLGIYQRKRLLRSLRLCASGIGAAEKR